jgi:hypothetical protein
MAERPWAQNSEDAERRGGAPCYARQQAESDTSHGTEMRFHPFTMGGGTSSVFAEVAAATFTEAARRTKKLKISTIAIFLIEAAPYFLGNNKYKQQPIKLFPKLSSVKNNFNAISL